jgi:hypothetical protein
MANAQYLAAKTKLLDWFYLFAGNTLLSLHQ